MRYAIAGLLALAALSGCGGSGRNATNQVVQGRELFQTGGRKGAQLGCGFCHSM